MIITILASITCPTPVFSLFNRAKQIPKAHIKPPPAKSPIKLIGWCGFFGFPNIERMPEIEKYPLFQIDKKVILHIYQNFAYIKYYP